MKNLLISIFLMFSLFAFSSTVTSHQQWFSNKFKYSLKNGYFITLSEQHKYTEHYFDCLCVRNWVGGFGKKIGKYSVSLNYKQEQHRGGLIEERFFVDLVRSLRLTKKYKFTVRERLERRHFKHSLEKARYRLRLLLKVSCRISIFNCTCTPYFSVEPQFSSIGNRLSRNRIYAGTKVELNKKVKLDIGYMREDNVGKEAKGVFFSGFDFSF